jgi:predicted TPR repeat methyltransferase
MEQPAADVRVVTLEEGISLAILLQSNGHLAEAEDIFRKVLERVPDHPQALHYFGVLTHQQGRSAAAMPYVERSIELEPGHADWYSNLGLILRSQDRFDEAAAAFGRAIELDPRHANAHNNLGGLLRAQGKTAAAEAAYRAAIEIDPAHADAYTNLGHLLTSQGRVPEALASYCKAIVANPRHAEGRRMVAYAYLTLGELDKAIEIYQEWVEQEPENPIPRHMLAACSGRDVPGRAEDAFVEMIFDGFAASFESRLARLSYRAPSLVAAVLEASGVEPAKQLDVLDAGCGTGLCGPLIAPYARRLVGVDLSAGMMAQAAEKKVYDELVKEELTAYLAARGDAFDVIVSADTLVYFGTLGEVIPAAARALRPGGRLIFTLEELADPSATDDFRIRPHGRYNHRRAYVERVLREAGLRPSVRAAELRMEGGVPVDGLVVCAVKDGVGADDREGRDG